MKKTKRPIAELAADPLNARAIDPDARAGLGVSLTRFGDLSGIVHNRRNGLLVSGHQRMAELVAAGAKEWRQTSEQSGEVKHPKTGEVFGVRIVEWDDETHRLANLTANNPAIQGVFTDAAAEQLAALDGAVDYGALRLDALAEQLALDADPTEPGGGDTDPDAEAVPPAIPTTKLGDLWILGEHRLLCGDSTNPEDVERLMGGGLAALGLHDPPYGMGAVEMGFGDGRRHGNAVAPRGRFRKIEGDDRPFDPRHLLSRGWPVVIWGENHFADKLPPSPAWIVWDKRVDLPSNSFSDCELAWCSSGGRAQVIRHVWNGMIRASERGEARIHPTQKPVMVYQEIITDRTEAGGIVHDGYVGSGTTIIACQRIGRRCFGLEIDPGYVDAAVARWEAFTGITAHREDRIPAPKPRGSRKRR